MGDGFDRRDLFRLGVTAGVTAMVSSCASSRDAPQKPVVDTGPDPLPAADIVEVEIAELQRRMTTGSETSRSLVGKYLARIEASNERGHRLRAVLDYDRAAEQAASALDAERKAGKVRGPLHGIPILVKDNIDTADLPTTAGSLALLGTRPLADAFAVKKLREAGALIFGKANLSEWANMRGTASSSGWSAIGGQCRNPYALDRSPSGSSSGSAVAAAASLCAAALGTETDGSISSPASCNALVGLKPTVGLVSRHGLIPISASQDTMGPMTRTVADTAAILAAIAGPDPSDPATAGVKVDDYLKALDPKALAGARIGVPRKGWFDINRKMDTLTEAAIDVLKRLGAVIVDPIDAPYAPDLGGAEMEVLLYEFKAQMAEYLARRGPDTKVKSLEDVIAFNLAHAKEELALFGQELFVQAQKKGPLSDAAYQAARATCIRAARTDSLDKAFATHKLDAIVGGTCAPAWLIDHVNGDSFGANCTTLPAVAGYPHLTVPMGYLTGLPVGLSFIGRAYTEAKLLGYGFAYEQATQHRKPPTYRASV